MMTKHSSIQATVQKADVFKVKDFSGLKANGRHDGIESLMNLLGRHGSYFYKSIQTSNLASPQGMFSKDDVVMIKVNSQWDKRGMTNVDLVQGVIKAILSHPDGFNGEVILVENVQFRESDFPSPNGNAFNWQRVTNSEDRRRTFEVMVNELKNEGKVSCFDWTTLPSRTTWPEDNHEMNAYHRPEHTIAEKACYPRFTTEYGTRINFRDGIWTGEGYNQEKLKLINIPVLKDHHTYNVTACVKNYMGVVINYYHDTFVRDCGIMMTTTRVPDLNILDCTFVGVSGGPGVGESGATEQYIIVAGRDPVSVDFYAAQNVLYPLTNKITHTPTPGDRRTNQLQRYLENARTELDVTGYYTVSVLSEDSIRVITPDTAVEDWHLFS